MASFVEESSQLIMPEGPGATIEDKVDAMGADFECRQLEDPLHGIARHAIGSWRIGGILRVAMAR